MPLGKITKLAVLALFAFAVLSLQALSTNDPPLPASAMADKVVVLKSQRTLLLMKGDEVLKRYIVSLGGDPVGPKIRQGDNKTPDINCLSVTELQLLSLLSAGDTSKEIAVKSGISVKTVEVHRHNILKKMKLKSTTALICYIQSHALEL